MLRVSLSVICNFVLSVLYCVMCVIVSYCNILSCTVLYCPVLHCSTLQPSINPFEVNKDDDNDDDDNSIPDDLIFICHGENLKSKTLFLSKVAK